VGCEIVTKKKMYIMKMLSLRNATERNLRRFGQGTHFWPKSCFFTRGRNDNRGCESDLREAYGGILMR
jgi:hypothetical protein